MCAAPLLCALLLLAAPGASAVDPSKCDGDSCAAEMDSASLLQSKAEIHGAAENNVKEDGRSAQCQDFNGDKTSCEEVDPSLTSFSDHLQAKLDTFSWWNQVTLPACAFVNELCTGIFDKVEIGGASSKDIHGKVVSRPSFRTQYHKDDQGVWSGCGGVENCWTGIDMVGNLPASVRGSLTDSMYTEAATELIIDCELSTKVKVSFRTAWVVNAKIRMSYNNEEFDLDPLFLSGHMRIITIPISNLDEDPVLYVWATRDDPSQDAHFGFTGSIKKVNVAFDHCMETKRAHGLCLEDLPQTSSIRSGQDEQTACIELESTGTPTGHCADWLACMDDVAKANILRINKAFSQPLGTGLSQQSASLISRTGDANCKGGTDFECHNPKTLDVEAFDCDCLDWVEGATQAKINERACENIDVCCTWKENHCDDFTAVPQLMQKANESLMKERSQQEDSQGEASLDESLSGKRGGDGC